MFEAGSTEKTAPMEIEKIVRQRTVSQVDRKVGKTARIAFQNVSATTVFSRFGPQRLLPVLKSQKNARQKEK